MVDLNKGHRKFYVDFDVSAEGGGEFDVLVVNQTQLDQVGPAKLALRTVRDTTSGNVRADSDDYQDYYLILRSGTPRTLTIKTRLTPLTEASSSATPPLSAATDEMVGASTTSGLLSFFRIRTWSDLPSSRIFWIVIALIVVLVLWCVFWKSRSGASSSSDAFVSVEDDDGREMYRAPLSFSDRASDDGGASVHSTATGTSPLSQAVQRFLSSQPVTAEN